MPLMAMLRHRRRTLPELEMRLVYSVRSADDVIYGGELDGTRSSPSRGEPLRLGGTGTAANRMPRCWPARSTGVGTAFVCGSNGFVESASQLLLAAGFEPQRVRTERFGPTG